MGSSFTSVKAAKNVAILASIYKSECESSCVLLKGAKNVAILVSVGWDLQVQVSLGRIAKFLKDDELENCVERTTPTDANHAAVEMQDATLSWTPEESKMNPTLRNVSLTVKPGDHVAVCGAVGSGKSTLLYSIMGEIPKLSGRVRILLFHLHQKKVIFTLI